jgi:hypothetical protein
MSLRSGFFVLFPAAMIIAGISGCYWKDQTGFVEIRKSGSLAGADVLLLNSTEIAGLAQKDRLIVQEPIGAATLQLKRGENSQKLCDFEIKKNRVVTVTVSYVNASMRCTVQS